MKRKTFTTTIKVSAAYKRKKKTYIRTEIRVSSEIAKTLGLEHNDQVKITVTKIGP